jgi:hypothetical protein
VAAITESEILAVIRDIEAGLLVVEKDTVWDMGGCPTFATSNGWRFVVFNDCGEWDYFESISAPDGRFVDEVIDAEMPVVAGYAPASLDAFRSWGFNDEEARLCSRFTGKTRGLGDRD